MKRIINNWKLKKILKRPLNNNEEDIYRFIAELKEFDFGIIQTMGLLCNKLKIGIPESREIVLNSPSWIDEKENFIEFNNKAWEVLEQEADKVEENEDGTVSLTFDLTNDEKK